ncbi:MAG: 30S ribosomal protein S20 [Planctomycetota bacterium]
MAHTLSAKKRIRQNAKRRAANRWRLRTLRAALKAFNSAEAAGDAAAATEAFKSASKVVDKTAQKGVIHKNQAARRKSRMNKRLKALKAG